MARSTQQNSDAGNGDNLESSSVSGFPERDDRANSTVDRIAGENDGANAGNDGIDIYTSAEPGTNTGTDSGTGNEPAEPPIKRIRKPRAGEAGKRKKAATKNLDLNAAARAQIVKRVVGVHLLADTILGVKGLCAISEEQSEALTDAVFSVAEQYDLKANPKLVAWANLAAVAGMIYAPKVMMIRALRAHNQRQAQEPAIKPAQPEQSADGKMSFA